MGVPKFFRWLSERYPKINQRYGNLPDVETARRHFPERSSPPSPLEEPDPLATCGLAPPIDRLYLDMNGIIHGCSHNNDDSEDEKGNSDDPSSKEISREEIFRNVCYYLDRVIGDMVQPEQLVYMAIDGVAPRAKMNQQRSRRYRSGGEGEIETTIYEAHMQAREEQERLRKLEEEEEDLYESEAESFGVAQRKYNNSNYSFILDADEGNSMGSASSSSSLYSHNENSSRDFNEGLETPSSTQDHPNEGHLQEVTRGRFKGKFQATTSGKNDKSSKSTSFANESTSAAASSAFHSNEITPGTPFFAEFTKHLEHFVKHKLSTDPKWKKLTIIFSGPNVPGEGEHKIMQFLREQREQPDYDPNLRHCIMGQDGDLMMLGLLTHEPNMVLLREKVVFNMSSARLEKAHAASKANEEPSNLNSTLDTYIYNPHFEFLHLQVLRDYLAYEFETSNVLSSSPWDIERTIDDFVFLTFLIGNDFLPHLPALDIADQAFDLLYYTYKQCRENWLKETNGNPYLTHAGEIVSGKRLEEFFKAVGSHEVTYYEKKKQTADAETRRLRKQYKKLKMKDTLPDDSIVASKEEADRAAYRTMLESQHEKQSNETETFEEEKGFVPVTTQKVEFQPIEDQLEDGIISRMGALLQNSLSNGSGQVEETDDESSYALSGYDDQDLKGRYYYDKFNFTPFDADKHRALRKAYMEGLVWNLKYYYEGCVSWDWFYPYHYGPMLSDLVELDEILDEISFDKSNMGAPLDPFDQLMGCMPPSQAHHLPEPYRPLMLDPDSPIIDFYPNSFVVDMNGKRWPWEAVTLLPFIDSNRLIEATSAIDKSKLSQEELDRNASGETIVIQNDPNHSESIPAVGKSQVFSTIEHCSAVSVPFEETSMSYKGSKTPVFKPEIKAGTQFPLPGFATLRDAPVETLYRRRLGINVHGGKSRYKTASLEVSSSMPPLPPLETLAPKLVGTTVFVNYPHFVEALVTAVSNEKMTVRGKKAPRKWTPEEANKWKLQRDGVVRKAEVGEGYCGTGGLIMPEDQPITLSVRPFAGFVTTKDDQTLKTFAAFELEIPLISTFWAPSRPDTRLIGVPSRLEKNAYEIAMSKNANDPLLGGLSGNKKNGKNGRSNRRRKLFPAKSSSKSRKNSSLNGESNLRSNSGKAKMSAANFSSFSNYQGNRKSYSTFSHAFHAPGAEPSVSIPQEWSTFGSISSHLPVSRQSTSASRVFARYAPKQSIQETACRKAVSYSQTNSRRLGYRGRIVAAGVAAAACLFHPASAARDAHSSGLSLWNKPPSNRDPCFRDNLEPWCIPRGGDLEENDALLPPQNSAPPIEFAHGTTTLSFAFQGGIIAAVDSRASMGQFVGSKTTQKVLPVGSHILGTMAGGAADCQHWIRKLKSEALLHELTEDGRRMSVARASRVLSNYLYSLRGYDLSVGTMIMGFDDNQSDEESPPCIYYVDNTGLRIQGDMFSVGSGSTFALGILDSQPDRYNLSVDDAIALGIKAIRHATFRDAYSGGYINVYLITPQDGWKKVYTEDIARTPEAWKAQREEMDK